MNLYLTHLSTDYDEASTENEFSFAGLGFSPYDMLLQYYGELDELAWESRVTPLSAFAVKDTAPEDEDQWFSATDGLKTVEALIDGLPNLDLPESDELLDELRRLKGELEMLRSTGRRFVFGIG
jgi:hypothetical protein